MDYGLAIATRSQCSTNLEVSSHCDVAPLTIESNYNAQRVPGPLQTMGVQLVMQSEYWSRKFIWQTRRCRTVRAYRNLAEERV